MAISDAAREARRAYKRKWAKENPEKVRAMQERYWEKRAARGNTPAHQPDAPDTENATQ